MGVTALGAFDQATAVRRTAGGRYDMQPDPRFSPAASSGDVQPAVNGGVLIAAMLRAVLDTSPHPHPVATSANFLQVPRIAPAQVEVSWLKQGKTAAVARTSLLQDDQLMIESTRHDRLARQRPAGPGAARGRAGGARVVLDRRSAQPAAGG